MPSLKDLKNRIESVKSTRKITKAMQMVAAAKLRRAQDAAESSRPYTERFNAVMAGLAGSAGGSDSAPKLLAGTGSDQTQLLVVMTSERGLCGGFNSSIVKLVRVALADGDCTRKLPSFSADTKHNDPRYGWFRQRYGRTCWELDALDPRLLRERVDVAIAELVDEQAWDHSYMVEQAELESMEKVLDDWRGILGQASE